MPANTTPGSVGRIQDKSSLTQVESKAGGLQMGGAGTASNKIVSTKTNTDITLEPNGTGKVIVSSNLDLSKSLIMSSEDVEGGSDATTNATALDVTKVFHFVSTATSKAHVKLADGVKGQIVFIVHKTRNNSTDLVITPAKLNGHTKITSNLHGRTVGLVFDGTNWNIMAGDIAEMVPS